MKNNTKRFLITAALPYANGPIHIGHLAGVYVPADIYVRYLRLRKKDVKFICGSDEHGVPITMRARKEGKTPQQIVDYFHKLNKQAFEDFGISFDIYSRTTSKIHYQLAQEFFLKLHKKGVFEVKETEQYYDPEAKMFLADRYITGTCPVCGYEHAYGDQCEKCGSSLSPEELINPKSTLTGSKLIKKKTKHWYLPLNKYEKFIQEWILEKHKDDWKENVIGQVSAWLRSGLKSRALTRDLDWGVPVPLEEAKGKVLYVWFEAPIGYISMTKELTNEWEKYWKDPNTKLVHFIGKDNIVFHCIIFPIILKEEGSFILPDNVPANEFLNLEDQKISTSKNWAIWLHQYLKDFPQKQDTLRYVLTVNAPETKDNNFTWKDFQRRNNKELVGDLGNFINRVLILTNKYFKGEVPEPNQLTDYDKQLLNKLKKLKTQIEQELETFHFRQAVNSAMNFSRLGNKYLAETEPWKLWKHDKERVKTILYLANQIVASLSILLEPFLPFSANKIRQMLNIEKPISWDKIAELDLIKPNHKLGQIKLLFEQISDEQIEKQLEKLHKSKAMENTKKLEPLKKEISYDDFAKMDIRVATIKQAEDLPKSKKLLKLTVDTGLDTRTILAGIKEQYKPQELIGKKVVILANLKPRKMMGYQSQGMVLMANDPDGKFVFISTEQDVENGSYIS